ncbi:hypothetical protein Lal_00047032 [Lupinus albus]|nr:hypothetical protein Lal_00047032 [Lupinus albus]
MEQRCEQINDERNCLVFGNKIQNMRRKDREKMLSSWCLLGLILEILPTDKKARRTEEGFRLTFDTFSNSRFAEIWLLNHHHHFWESEMKI